MSNLNRNIVAAALALAWSSVGLAGTTSTTFNVNGVVVAACTVTAANLNFGASIASPIASNIDAQNNLTATCANGTVYTIQLGAGNGGAATFAQRKMTATGGSTMAYSLFTDAARATVWGDGTSASATVSGTGTGSAQLIPVFGRVFSGQNPPAFNYSDVINVTLNF